MRHRLVFLAVAGAALMAGQVSMFGAEDPLGKYPPGYTQVNPRTYVYVPPSYVPVPPLTAYGYGYGPFYGGGGYLPPPIGFGSPYYNGYGDPAYPLYGPGVQDFLRFGGADFYGW